MDFPLQNKTIVITRDKSQAQSIIEKLSQLGAQTMAFPTIEIAEPEDWSPCDKALERLDQYHWIIFSSTNGVRYFMDRARMLGIPGFNCQVACIGSKTMREAMRYDLKVDLVPESFNAEGLLRAIADYNLKGSRVLIPSSDIARSALSEGLSNMGAIVQSLVVYRTLPFHGNAAENFKRKIKDHQIDCITFFSPSSFHYLAKILGEEILEYIRTPAVAIAAIGPTTASALREAGIEPDILPGSSTEESLLTAMVEYFRNSV